MPWNKGVSVAFPSPTQQGKTCKSLSHYETLLKFQNKFGKERKEQLIIPVLAWLERKRGKSK